LVAVPPIAPSPQPLMIWYQGAAPFVPGRARAAPWPNPSSTPHATRDGVEHLYFPAWGRPFCLHRARAGAVGGIQASDPMPVHGGDIADVGQEIRARQQAGFIVPPRLDKALICAARPRSPVGCPTWDLSSRHLAAITICHADGAGEASFVAQIRRIVMHPGSSCGVVGLAPDAARPVTMLIQGTRRGPTQSRACRDVRG